MIYLDNSSTTFKKPYCVKKIIKKGINNYNINPSRANYKKAIDLAKKIYSCREIISETFGTIPEKVIFTSGCTESLNLAIQGTVKKNGHIITTIYEHNSVLRVLESLKNSHNICYTILTPNKLGKITSQEISKAIKSNTYMIIINHTSNVIGCTQNIESIGKIAKKHGLIFLVDGAQSIGHEYINMQENNINLLTIAGHKGLYAPQGIGCLLINNAEVLPIKMGGTGTFSDSIKQPIDYPEGLESGTPNVLGILGMKKGIEFVNKNQEKINKKISKMTKYLIENLNRIKNITVYSGEHKSGVVSITIKGKDSSEVSNILDDKFSIATRSGLHCAPLVHKYYKTLKNGMTRISLSYFNKMKEIKKLILAIEKIALD